MFDRSLEHDSSGFEPFSTLNVVGRIQVARPVTEADRRDVFISYSRKDERFVRKLVAHLKDRGVQPWVDTLEIEVGDKPRMKVQRGIENSRYFCLVVTPASLKSFYVWEHEVEAAFTLMTRKRREGFILPILRNVSGKKLPLSGPTGAAAPQGRCRDALGPHGHTSNRLAAGP